MCGIVGAISASSDEGLVNPDVIRAAADRLATRGPDDFGVWIRDGAGFGHRRLSVIDTSSAGHQPMTTEDGRFVLVFNGEVYNHAELRREIGAAYSWRGHSDSESVLAAYSCWGPACVSRFHGMFAFAIWDTQRRVLFAARDRMGVKPFYYHHSPGHFAFASRPAALRKLLHHQSLNPDVQALRYYLEGGYIPAPYAFHEGVHKLPPGHSLQLENGRLRIERYWDFRHIEPQQSWNNRDEEDLLDELDEILIRSVRSRMISDVPLGAFLSGGIDSSLVVAIMARYSATPVQTFTIGFSDPKYDESRHAEAVARHIGTDHHSEMLDVDSLLKLLPEFSRQYDEPFYDSSAFPTMAVSRLARRSVTVSLSGDGGDELFGGYHYYRIARRVEKVYRAPFHLHRLAGLVAGLVPEHRFKLLAGALKEDTPVEFFAFSRSIGKDYEIPLEPQVMEQTNGYKRLFRDAAQRMCPGLDVSELGMRLDATYTLSDDYLQKVDVGSMSFSLESREPLLDHELVEWAMQLPVQWKLRGEVTKYLLRKLAYRYVPAAILDRPKQGFAVPIDRWLRGQLRDWALERIHDERIYAYLPVDRDKVLSLFRLHESGKREVHPLIWAILMLIEYCYQHENIT